MHGGGDLAEDRLANPQWTRRGRGLCADGNAARRSVDGTADVDDVTDAEWLALRAFAGAEGDGCARRNPRSVGGRYVEHDVEGGEIGDLDHRLTDVDGRAERCRELGEDAGDGTAKGRELGGASGDGRG